MSEFAWPHFHKMRPAEPKLVYLDLNHWIYLAQAFVGSGKGQQYTEILEQCETARENGRAIFPLSLVHYMEMTKNYNSRQRQDVAHVMELLSGFQVLLGLTDIRDFEADAAYARCLGVAPIMQAATSPIGFGLGYSLGGYGELQIHDTNGEITEQFANDDPVLWEKLLLFKERHLLRGPNDEEIEELRKDGWSPESFIKSHDELVLAELQLVENMNDPVLSEGKNWRKGRLRDVIEARELCSSYIDRLNTLQKFYYVRNAEAREKILTSKNVHDEETMKAFARYMPSFEVFVDMKVSAHRNMETKWDGNDLFDMQAMSIAIPYCDIVVTENHAAHQIKASKLDKRMNTTVISQLELLPALIE